MEWLANQAYADGGWGYQKYETIEACKSSVPMTAFAMKALGLALQQSYIQNLVNVKEIKGKLVTGLDYLKKMKNEKNLKFYLTDRKICLILIQVGRSW